MEWARARGWEFNLGLAQSLPWHTAGVRSQHSGAKEQDTLTAKLKYSLSLSTLGRFSMDRESLSRAGLQHDAAEAGGGSTAHRPAPDSLPPFGSWQQGT